MPSPVIDGPRSSGSSSPAIVVVEAGIIACLRDAAVSAQARRHPLKRSAAVGTSEPGSGRKQVQALHAASNRVRASATAAGTAADAPIAIAGSSTRRLLVANSALAARIEASAAASAPAAAPGPPPPPNTAGSSISESRAAAASDTISRVNASSACMRLRALRAASPKSRGRLRTGPVCPQQRGEPWGHGLRLQRSCSFHRHRDSSLRSGGVSNSGSVSEGGGQCGERLPRERLSRAIAEAPAARRALNECFNNGGGRCDASS
jgi:hypothetical protein